MSVDDFATLTGLNVTDNVVDVGSRRDVASWQTIVVAIVLTPIIVLGMIGNIFSLLVWIKGNFLLGLCRYIFLLFLILL